MNLREAEANSIRAFVQSAADEGYLSGRVLDYGCGRQPYRDIVEAAGGDYHPFDLNTFPASVSDEDWTPAGFTFWGSDGPLDVATALHKWTRDHGYIDAVLCTQVVQYVPFAEYHERTLSWSFPLGDLFTDLRILMDEGNETLVLTYPTNWPEVEPEDLHRFTKAGMERLLTEAGFEIIRHDWRHGFRIDSGESFAAGYGVIARA